MSTQDFFQFCKDSFSDADKSILSKVGLAVGIMTGAIFFIFFTWVVVAVLITLPVLIVAGVGGFLAALTVKAILDYDEWKIKNNRPRKTTNRPFPG